MIDNLIVLQVYREDDGSLLRSNAAIEVGVLLVAIHLLHRGESDGMSHTVEHTLELTTRVVEVVDNNTILHIGISLEDERNLYNMVVIPIVVILVHILTHIILKEDFFIHWIAKHIDVPVGFAIGIIFVERSDWE